MNDLVQQLINPVIYHPQGGEHYGAWVASQKKKEGRVRLDQTGIYARDRKAYELRNQGMTPLEIAADMACETSFVNHMIRSHRQRISKGIANG